MKSAAEPRASLAVRGGALFDRVDYRPIETPEEKDHLYAMRYKAYTRGGLIPLSGSERYSDSYDDAPNAWTFGIYVDGELYSSIRLHVLTSEQRMSCTTDLFGDVLNPRLDRGEVFIDPARFVADPEKAQRFPELPYLTVRLAYLACEYFNGICAPFANAVDVTVITAAPRPPPPPRPPRPPPPRCANAS